MAKLTENQYMELLKTVVVKGDQTDNNAIKKSINIPLSIQVAYYSNLIELNPAQSALNSLRNILKSEHKQLSIHRNKLKQYLAGLEFLVEKIRVLENQ